MDNKTKTLTKILKTTQNQIYNTSRDFTKNLQGNYTHRLLDRPTYCQSRRENKSEIFGKRKRIKNICEDRETKQ